MAEKILVVDDDPTSSKLISSLLKGRDYEVAVAGDGEEGLQKVNAEKFHLIVLDVMMPRMDGYTFLRELKKINYFQVPPIIMLTVKDQMEPTFRLEGAVAFFIKPLDTKSFLRKVDHLLKPELACTTCGKQTTESGHLCVPISKEDKKCDWCGSLIANERHLCDKKIKELSYICNSCGRTAVKAEHLCSPSAINKKAKRKPAAKKKVKAQKKKKAS